MVSSASSTRFPWTAFSRAGTATSAGCTTTPRRTTPSSGSSRSTTPPPAACCSWQEDVRDDGELLAHPCRREAVSRSRAPHERIAQGGLSKTLDKTTWQNTTIVAGDPVGAAKKLKGEAGKPIVILGSGTIVSLLTHAGLIDEYQILVIPTVLSEGATMFEGAGKTLNLELASSRSFRNNKAFLVYRPKG